jgi:hypothetical protein
MTLSSSAMPPTFARLVAQQHNGESVPKPVVSSCEITVWASGAFDRPGRSAEFQAEKSRGRSHVEPCIRDVERWPPAGSFALQSATSWILP